MTRFLRFFGALRRALAVRVPLPRTRTGKLVAVLSFLAVIGLGYFGGAAVMYFQLPPSDFLNKAFAGFTAWADRGQSSNSL